MTYKKLAQAMRQYSRTDDLCKSGLGVEGSRIRENVILTPGWTPERVSGLGEAKLVSASGPLYGITVWEINVDGQGITYIKTGCGAPPVMDALLSLGETGCKRVLFLSSIGGLAPEMEVGDLVLPEYSVSGDGASRYLTDGFEDTLGEKAYPDPELFARLREETQAMRASENLRWHLGRPFCEDTLLAQFHHIPDILARGCNTLDMESAVAFRAGALMGLPVAALQCVSDNSLAKKSLLGGVSGEEQARRNYVRGQVIPVILKNLFKSLA